MTLKKDLKVRNVLRVALYIRVSSLNQAEEGYSLGEQEERLRKYADAMSWEIYKVYIDPGYSGGDTDRPGLKSMIRDIEDGLIDKVVVYKLDRLSRSQLDTLYLIEKVFVANNTDFVSMSENFDTSTPFGRAMIGILAVFAQLEKDKINERMVMGKEARAKEGKWNGGSSVPVGYEYDIEKELLIVNDYEKMQLLEAADLFLKGTPLRTICNIFFNKGYVYKGTSGKISIWEPKRLRYVFRNKTYIGYIKYRGEWYKAEHEPIFDNDTWDKIQKLMDERKEMFDKHAKRCANQTTYLGGMIYCKQCTARYTKQRGKVWKGQEPPVYYVCYSRNKKVRAMIKNPNCKNKNWKMHELDDIILGEIKKLATDPEYIPNIRKERRKNIAEPQKLDILRDQIEELENQISRFMDLYGIGKFTIEQVSAKVDPLNEQKNRLQRELTEHSVEVGAISEEDVAEIVQNCDDIIERGDFNEIRMMIESLIEKIELDNDDVYIHWRFA